MIYVGIDVAKDKHDCCILGSEADKLFPVFTIPNNKAGFDELYEKMFSVTDDKTKIKVGLVLKLPVTTHSIFSDRSLIKVYPPVLSTRYIPIFTEKV